MPEAGDFVIPSPPSGKIINRHRALKKTFKLGATAASIGVSAAQMGTGTGALALMTGAAVSATGVGLVVAGGVLTVGTCLASGRSAYKTKKHIDGLKSLQTSAQSMSCEVVHAEALHGIANTFHHEIILKGVLPYVIKKKTSKFHRKAATTVPGVALLEGLRAIGKKGYKYVKGSLGVNRENAATWLAHHLLTYECELAEAIVEELYGSEDEVIWLKQQDGEVVVQLLMDKMKST
ncbi:MAG: hypothetical protein JNG89_00975 [Planctomycetaceae bacterium]|nr:hypothetical protein [Planctomycetaceae bacterium]